MSQIARLKTGVLFFPKANRIRMNAVPSAQLGRRRAGLELIEYPDDLSFAETGLLRGEVSLGLKPEISPFQLVRICPIRSEARTTVTAQLHPLRRLALLSIS